MDAIADEVPWRGLWHVTRGRGRWRDEWVTHLVIYVIVPLGIALLQLPAHWTLAVLPVGYAQVLVVMLAVGGSFELQYRFLWPRVLRDKPGWAVRLAAHAATLVLAVVPGCLLASLVFEALWGYPAHEVRQRLWRVVPVLSITLVAVLIALDELAARARAFEVREARARVAALRAELAALQARTDPHFLFNSLNTVAALIPEDAVRAEAMLERLAAVFRYALDAGRRASVPLGDELAAVAAYLGVEEARLEGRLVWRIERDGDDALQRVAVPPLLLQPLAENAVRHGAAQRRGATEVVVSVARRADQVVLAVEDRTGGAVAPSTVSGSGTSLAELAARLALLHGERASLTAGPTAAGWRAEVTLPAEVA